MSGQYQYREPPPYPGHSKHVFCTQSGFRESCSGSEASTDVSLSSTESLATWQRQDPLGEETQSPFYNCLENSSYSIMARLGLPPSLVHFTMPADKVMSLSDKSLHHQETQSNYTQRSSCPHSVHAQSAILSNVNGNAGDGEIFFSKDTICLPHSQMCDLQPFGQVGTFFNTASSNRPDSKIFYGHSHRSNSSVIGCHDKTFHNLSSSQQPPPKNPGMSAKDSSVVNSIGMESDFTHRYPLICESCPDLVDSGAPSSSLNQRFQRILASTELHSSNVHHRPGSRNEASLERSQCQLIGVLSEENRKLRTELDDCYKKVSKLEKFELIIEKVQEDYEFLVKSSEKRQCLETVLMSKFEDEVRKMKAENDILKSHVQCTCPVKQQPIQDTRKSAITEVDRQFEVVPESDKLDNNAEHQYVEHQIAEEVDPRQAPHTPAPVTCSVEIDRLAGQGHTDPHHLAYLSQSGKREAELESMIRSLQVQLAQKDDIIKLNLCSPHLPVTSVSSSVPPLYDSNTGIVSTGHQTTSGHLVTRGQTKRETPDRDAAASDAVVLDADGQPDEETAVWHV